MIVQLKAVPLIWPLQLTKAAEYQNNGKPKFRTGFVVEKGSDNHKRLGEAIKQVATEAWKKEALVKANLAKFKGDSRSYPLREGDEFTDSEGVPYPFLANHLVLFANRSEDRGAPKILGDGPDGKLPLTDLSKIYSGAIVNTAVDIWAQATGKNLGIRAELRVVLLHGHGDPLPVGGGSSPSADEVDGITKKIADIDNDDIDF